jgi:hypothetical protein
MASRINKKNLNHILHPYQFVLKEGPKIRDDFMDYSLLILQIGKPETIKSPRLYLSNGNASQVFN